MSTFARKLNKLFEQKVKPNGNKYSPEDIQALTNKAVTASYVWRLLSGKADNPTYKVIKVLSEFFEISPAYFFEDDPTEDSKENKIDEFSKKLLNRSSSMETSEKDFILRMMEEITKIRK